MREQPDQVPRSPVEIRLVDPASAVAVAAVREFLVEIDRRLAQGFDVDAALVADAASRGSVPWSFLVATASATATETAGAGADRAGSALRPIACGGVRRLGPGVGELKRMWVHADWRGVGLGGRLLRRLEEEALAMGLPTLRLDTHLSLTEALGLYDRAGYRRIPRYNDNPDAQAWFEKVLSPAG